MKKPVALCLIATLTSSACAGRTPSPVETVQRGDAELSCSELRTEINTNTNTLQSLRREQGDKAAKNAVAGVAGAFLLVPWFFIDAKGAAGEEARALQNRNHGLVTRYKNKQCQPKIVLQKEEAAEATE